MEPVPLHGHFTASIRETPTFEKLDRVLASVEWEQKVPLATVQALTRTGLDHTPLLTDSGVQAHLGNTSQFSFELSWLRVKFTVLERQKR